MQLLFLRVRSYQAIQIWRFEPVKFFGQSDYIADAVVSGPGLEQIAKGQRG